MSGRRGSSAGVRGQNVVLCAECFDLEQYRFRITATGEMQLVAQDPAWGIDTLKDIETVRFGDQEVATRSSHLEPEQLLNTAAIYQLITGQPPTLDDLNACTVEEETTATAQRILTTGPAADFWAGLNNREYVGELVGRVLDSSLSETDLDYFQNLLDEGELSRAEGFVIALGVEAYQTGLFADGGMILA